jgi:transcription initiation factor IIF auxiliary subunit
VISCRGCDTYESHANRLLNGYHTRSTHTPPPRIYTEKREGGDQFTHKWKMYVCGPAEDPDISHFIKKVRFFLHPSYKPNDIIEITHSPFTLTRWGWGEFPIRVQLHLRSSNRKTIDIIHQLLLDKSLTGSQVLGSERPYTVEVDRAIIEQKSLPDETVSTAESFQMIEEVACRSVAINNDTILTKTPGIIESESKLDNLIHSIIEDYPLVRKGKRLLEAIRIYCIE